MAQIQSRTRLVAFFTTLVFLMVFVQMLTSGSVLLSSLLAATIMAALTGVMATLGLMYREYVQRRAFAGKKQAGQSIDSDQQRTVEIDLPRDRAFDLVMEALQTLDGQKVPVADDVLVKLENLLPRRQRLKIHEADQAQGVIHAGLRAKVMGIPELVDFSQIDVQLQTLDPDTTQVHIESKTNNLFDVYDLGKNLHYVNTIALYLRRESQHLTAESRLSGHQTDTMHDDDTDEDAAQQTQSR